MDIQWKKQWEIMGKMKGKEGNHHCEMNEIIDVNKTFELRTELSKMF
jgi:hypothetical protein